MLADAHAKSSGPSSGQKSLENFSKTAGIPAVLDEFVSL